MSKIYFFGIAEGQDFDEVPADGGLTASEFQATLPAGANVTDYFKEGSDAWVTEVAESANTVGADVTKFATWSWAAVAGELAAF